MGNVVPPQACLPTLDCNTLSPMFDHKMELRAPHFDPTAMLFISILTIDKSNEEVRIVGYAAMNLFLGSKNKRPP